jgi:hypothetical protein
MRILILGLVLANLAFFGWAHWIAAEPAPRADPAQAAVPPLKLAREVAAPEAPPAENTPPPAGAQIATPAGSDSTPPAAAAQGAREPAPEVAPEAASAPPLAPADVAPAGVATR